MRISSHLGDEVLCCLLECSSLALQQALPWMFSTRLAYSSGCQRIVHASAYEDAVAVAVALALEVVVSSEIPLGWGFSTVFSQGK